MDGDEKDKSRLFLTIPFSPNLSGQNSTAGSGLRRRLPDVTTSIYEIIVKFQM
jgi:hypothetical protein